MDFLPHPLPVLIAIGLVVVGVPLIWRLMTVPCRGGCGRRIRSNDPLGYAVCGLCRTHPGWRGWYR